MSNYPPGVTGNEYEIAGGDETEEYWECESMVTAVTVNMPMIQEMADDGLTIYNRLKEYNYDSYQALIDQKLKSLRNKIHSLIHSNDAIEVDCGFAGYVLMESYRGKKWWSCPDCLMEHEVEIDDWRD
jgi:hypothetical protein